MEPTNNDVLTQTYDEDGAEIKVEKIDFKMVTFTLSGKDYGIDIMKVAEISKAYKFTYVPNSMPFVRGVYNLRGDIISIIDLRVMFHLPIPPKNEADPENMIILRLDDHVMGIIVDSIDKVVGIASSKIQPPHPLFGDINVKFISGVVDYENKLYIILDAERILGFEEESEDEGNEIAELKPAKTDLLAKTESFHKEVEEQDQDFNFVRESLPTIKNFIPGAINDAWLEKRFDEWKTERSYNGKGLQFNETADADDFLKSFYSHSTGSLWDAQHINKVKEVLPVFEGNQILVWNAGCGSGAETYSIAVMLRSMYPEKVLKIWANDKDLLSISNAPTMTVDKEFVPDIYHPYLKESKDTYIFAPDIKDLILFEYHDVLHANTFPAVDIIVARDLLSFMSLENQARMTKEFHTKLKPKGLLILGENEYISGEDWLETDSESISAFQKKGE